MRGDILAQGLKYFLRKDVPDIARGLITFLNGLKSNANVEFGDFASGMTGFGGRIDGQGNGELESLIVRRFLEVPELRYNRVEVLIGDRWSAPGAGIVESVVPDTDTEGNLLTTGTITLKLEDGEIGTVAVDDICMGIFHDYADTGNNAPSSSDDGKGNFRFAGFATCYFRIIEILDTERNSKFRYMLRAASDSWPYTVHPYEAMHFVGYGNFTDKQRQTSNYSTRTYWRFLREVNTWEFGAANIGAQFGDLSNLSVFGINMSGYSAYLNNIYMSGTIEQNVPLPLRMEIDTQGDTTMAWGETLQVVCAVFRGWEELTGEVTGWSVTRDSGDAADDAAWQLKDKAKNFDGSLGISYKQEDNDLGGNSLSSSTLFTFTATVGEETTEMVLEMVK